MRRDATRPLTPAYARRPRSGPARRPTRARFCRDTDAPARHRSRKYEVEYEGRGGCGPRGTQRGARAGHARSGRRSGRRARQARARRSRVVGSRDAARSRAGPRVSRHSCPDVVSAPTRAARSAAAEPIRTQAPGDARRRPRRRGPERPRGGRRETVRRAFAGPAPLVPRRSRSSGRPARTPTRCTKKFMRLPPPPRRGRSVVRTATVALVVKTLASRNASTASSKYRVGLYIRHKKPNREPNVIIRVFPPSVDSCLFTLLSSPSAAWSVVRASSQAERPGRSRIARARHPGGGIVNRPAM